MFRRTCEVTLRLARKEYECLVNVLETLVHDPLLEWSTRSKQRSSNHAMNANAGKEAQVHIDTVKHKLLGQGPQRRGMPLSIEGQVRVVRYCPRQRQAAETERMVVQADLTFLFSFAHDCRFGRCRSTS